MFILSLSMFFVPSRHSGVLRAGIWTLYSHSDPLNVIGWGGGPWDFSDSPKFKFHFPFLNLTLRDFGHWLWTGTWTQACQFLENFNQNWLREIDLDASRASPAVSQSPIISDKPHSLLKLPVPPLLILIYKSWIQLVHKNDWFNYTFIAEAGSCL